MEIINPKISIIIPAYNAGLYISETLECVLKQTEQEYEVLIINDGSFDNTQSIIEDYKKKDDRIRSFYQLNQGLSASRNNAMHYAKGEYIAFLDADDLVTDDYLEKLYAAAKACDADVAKCSMEDFDSETGERSLTCDVCERMVEYEPGHRYVFHYSPCAGIIRRKFLSDYGIDFSVGEQMEDSPYSLAVNILSGNPAVIKEAMYLHRINHSSSIITKVNSAKGDPKIPYKGIEKTIQMIQSAGIDDSRLDFFEYTVVRTLANFTAVQYKKYGKDVRKPLCDYCYRIIGTYFPNIMKNPYIFGKKQKNIGNIPFTFRAAVKMFTLSYELRLLNMYSSLCSKIF